MLNLSEICFHIIFWYLKEKSTWDSAVQEKWLLFSLQGMLTYIAGTFPWGYLSSNWVAFHIIKIL
jgi:hypothetical protein